MSSGSWRQADVGCPFYRHDDGKRVITCEGLIPQSDTKSRFESRAAQQRHMDAYCCGRYICCEIYRALMDKYEEGCT